MGDEFRVVQVVRQRGKEEGERAIQSPSRTLYIAAFPDLCQ